MTAVHVQRPLLRWAGSKRAQLGVMLPLVPTFERYVEPFAGSACLFFRLAPAVAILGDTNHELLNFYHVVTSTPLKLHARIASIPATRASYNEVRDTSPKSRFARATRFGYLNRNCFNAVYRTNRQGRFNVPFGARTGELPSAREFQGAARLLRRAALVSADFRVVLDSAQAGDFVYLDPPYVNRFRSTYGEYGYGSFGPDDVADFQAVVSSLHARRCKVLISYGDDSVLSAATRHFKTRTINARRTVSGDASKRVIGTEILAWNYDL
jgi:DNA adenine methylase